MVYVRNKILLSIQVLFCLGFSSFSLAAPSTFMCGSVAQQKYPSTDASRLGTAASPASGECSSSKNVYAFTGEAKGEMVLFGTDIAAAGSEIAEAISKTAANEIETMSKGTESLIKSMVTIANSQIKDNLKQDKMFLDMEMNYASELKERELKSEQSVMGLDDSKEEILFLMNELKNVGNTNSDGSYNHAQEVVAALKAKYDDDPEFRMPIRIKAASSRSGNGDGCAEYDPTAHKNGELDGTCFYSIKANPGAKLEKYFEECSRLKASSISSVNRNVSRKVAKASQKRSQSHYRNKSYSQSPAEMSLTKISKQKETSCSVKEFGYKICGKDEDGNQLSTEDYLTKVIDLEIIPFGNVSSSNFLSPVSIGSTDGDIGDISEKELKSMAATILDYKKIDEDDPDSDPLIAASTNTPKIVKTYRTSAQYFAAVDFTNNIINKEAVSGINVTRATNSSNALFQSKFMARESALSLAENSFRNSIAARTGTSINQKISGSLSDEDSFNRSSEIVREDVNGAGSMDVLTYSVDKDYNRLQSDAKSVISGNGLTQLNTAPNKVSNWKVDSMIRSNQITLMTYEQNERIELLLAAIVAGEANSESNINYINSLRLK